MLIQEALGTDEKKCQPCELNTRDVARRSLLLAHALKKGDALTQDQIVIMRPGTGIAPKHLPEVIGKKVATDLAEGTVLTPEMIA